MLQGKADPQASSSAAASRSTLGCCAGPVGSAVYIAGEILMELETWEPLLWSAFPAWTALFSLLSLHLSSGCPWDSVGLVEQMFHHGHGWALPLCPSCRTSQVLCHQGQVRIRFPFSFSPLFSSCATWLCCIVLGIVLKKGP